MAFYLPTFNLLSNNVWVSPHTPAADPPDFIDIPCQKFLESRGSGIDSEYDHFEYWHPHVLVRFPLARDDVWLVGWIWEIPAGSLRYYRVSFKEHVHEGFPNEYLVHFCCQCDGDGLAVAYAVDLS